MTPAEEHRRVAGVFTDRVLGTTDWDANAPVEGWQARDVVRHLVEWFPSFLEAGAGIALERDESIVGAEAPERVDPSGSLAVPAAAALGSPSSATTLLSRAASCWMAAMATWRLSRASSR